MKFNNKCKFCNSNFTYDLLKSLDKAIPDYCCEECVEIYSLCSTIKTHHYEQINKIFDNPISNKNMKTEQILDNNCCVCSYTDCEITYEINERNNEIEDIIKRIEFMRKLIVSDIGGYIYILDSICNKKHSFWKSSGNLARYVYYSSLQHVIIFLNECKCGSDSKYSIDKLKKCIDSNPKVKASNQQINIVCSFKNNDVIKCEYTPFPIDEFIKLIDNACKKYEELLGSIKHARNKYFAHINEISDTQPFNELTFVNISRAYNLLKVIFDAFLFVIAPDKYFSIGPIEYNIHLDHLEKIITKNQSL